MQLAYNVQPNLMPYPVNWDKSDAMQEAVAIEAKYLLAADFSPTLPRNILEFLDNCPRFNAELTKLIVNYGSHELKESLTDYWTRSAERYAEFLVIEKQQPNGE